MAYWEFLLQREGDRDWLPLETAHVEILEGRYRIMAHTSYRGATVHIRLSRLLADQMPPKRQVLKRQGETNPEGLMVVMPFTHLTAGDWAVQCAGMTGNDEDPRPWQYSVQLRVVPSEATLDEWDEPWEPVVEISSEQAAESAAAGTAEAEAAEPLRSDSAAAVISSSEPAPTLEPEQVRSDSPASKLRLQLGVEPPALEPDELSQLPLRLLLQQQALVAQQGHTVTVRGEVLAIADFAELSPDLTTGQIWVQLRDPEQGTVLLKGGRAIALSPLPTRFELPITLPETCETRLVVGEMSLWTAATVPQVLAIQGFTITLNLDALLETVANQGETAADGADFEEPTDAVPEASKAGKALEAPIPREVPFKLIYLPATGFTLPPQIHTPETSERRVIDLPNLPNRSGRSRPTVSTEGAKSIQLPPLGQASTPSTPSSDEADGDAAAPPIADSGRSLSLPPLAQIPAPESSEIPTFSELGPGLSAAETGVSEVPGGEAFQALKLHDRFWSRLSALAQEGQAITESLRAEMAAAGVEVSAIPIVDPPSVPPSMPDSHEVVVYDTPIAETNDTGEAEQEAAAAPTFPEAEATLEALPELPVPIFDLPDGSLVAGDPLTLRVQLPRLERRLAVKFWMTDVQSRNLIEQPRWLMTWTPTDNQQQVAILQLQVPLGCLEATFEAIAIDLATQRESYKATQTRQIRPANLPELEEDGI